MFWAGDEKVLGPIVTDTIISSDEDDTINYYNHTPKRNDRINSHANQSINKKCRDKLLGPLVLSYPGHDLDAAGAIYMVPPAKILFLVVHITIDDPDRPVCVHVLVKQRPCASRPPIRRRPSSLRAARRASRRRRPDSATGCPPARLCRRPPIHAARQLQPPSHPPPPARPPRGPARQPPPPLGLGRRPPALRAARRASRRRRSDLAAARPPSARPGAPTAAARPPALRAAGHASRRRSDLVT
uniref:Uncharacterized protein n=1 Tax=Oryza sativa subsp. japonica TaxID=39947 RepID=Q84NM0_ORYSJ|nr:hypothetical protein [Oryza sativa Japonica Group]